MIGFCHSRIYWPKLKKKKIKRGGKKKEKTERGEGLRSLSRKIKANSRKLSPLPQICLKKLRHVWEKCVVFSKIGNYFLQDFRHRIRSFHIEVLFPFQSLKLKLNWKVPWFTFTLIVQFSWPEIHERKNWSFQRAISLLFMFLKIQIIITLLDLILTVFWCV